MTAQEAQAMLNDALSAPEEQLLAEIKHSVVTLLDAKYRRGARLNKHNLLKLDSKEVLVEALREALDEVVYLFFLAKKLGIRIELDESWL